VGPLPIPTVNDTTNVGALIAENTTVSTQDVAFSQLVLDAYKYTSKAVLVSVELMQDNSINLPQVLGRLLGERLGRITNTHFTTGTGTGQPERCRDRGDLRAGADRQRHDHHLRQPRRALSLARSGVPRQREVHDERQRRCRRSNCSSTRRVVPCGSRASSAARPTRFSARHTSSIRTWRR
jgi:hypothetical protein